MEKTQEVSLGIRVAITADKTIATITTIGNDDPIVMEFPGGTSREQAIGQILCRLQA